MRRVMTAWRVWPAKMQYLNRSAESQPAAELRVGQTEYRRTSGEVTNFRDRK
jgi:hypothetical protein